MICESMLAMTQTRPRTTAAAGAYYSAPWLPEPTRAAATPRRRVAGWPATPLIFSVATGLSRIAGLVREVVAAAYFGTSGAGVGVHARLPGPEPVRALVADAALSAAFVPVFTELLEQRAPRRRSTLASALAGLLLVALTAITLRLHRARAA